MSHVIGLSGLSLSDVAKGTWSKIRAADVFGRTAQLACYFFLALFPFLICVIASLSVFLESLIVGGNCCLGFSAGSFRRQHFN